MAPDPEEYQIAWQTAGLARNTNASNMAGRVSAQHWFCKVAAHLLQAAGVDYLVTYCQMNQFFWITGNFGDCTVVSVAWTSTGVEKVYVEECIRAALDADTLPLPYTAHSWADVCAVAANALRVLAVPRPNVVVAAHVRQLQLLGGAGGVQAAFNGAAAARDTAEYLEGLLCSSVLAVTDGQQVLAEMEAYFAVHNGNGIGRTLVANRDLAGGSYATVASELLAAADQYTKSGGLLATKPLIVQQTKVLIFMSNTRAKPPIFSLPEPTLAAVLQHQIYRLELTPFATHFATGWRWYNNFRAALPGASDADAQIHIGSWLSSISPSADVTAISIAGLHGKVGDALPAVAALAAPSLAQRAKEVERVLVGDAAQSRDDPSAPKTSILHADAGYQALLRALRPFDTEPLDHLGACLVMLQHAGSSYGRALLCVTGSAEKFAKADPIWRRMHEARSYVTSALATSICLSAAGQRVPALTKCLEKATATKILGGFLGHGSGAEKLDVYADVILPVAAVEKPDGSGVVHVPTAHVFTSTQTFYKAVKVYRRVWIAVGEDVEAAAGYDGFFDNIRGLLERAEEFQPDSRARHTILYHVGKLVELATESRAQRKRAAQSGDLHAASDSCVWVAAGSDVESAYATAVAKADQLEQDALDQRHAAAHGAAGGPPPSMPKQRSRPQSR